MGAQTDQAPSIGEAHLPGPCGSALGPPPPNPQGHNPARSPLRNPRCWAETSLSGVGGKLFFFCYHDRTSSFMDHQGENTLKTSLGPASPQEGPRGLGFCRERPVRRWPRSGRPEQPSLVAQAPGTPSSGSGVRSWDWGGLPGRALVACCGATISCALAGGGRWGDRDGGRGELGSLLTRALTPPAPRTPPNSIPRGRSELQHVHLETGSSPSNQK